VSGLDVALGLVMAVGVWRGVKTGALRQVVGTVGWVVGFVAASALMAPVGEAVAASIGTSPRTAPILGFIVVLGAVLGGLTVVTHALRKTLEAIKLGALDTAAGGAVGAVRAAFGVSLLLLTVTHLPLPGGPPVVASAEERSESVLYDPVEALAPEVWGVVRAVTPGMQSALVDKFEAMQPGGDA